MRIVSRTRVLFTTHIAKAPLSQPEPSKRYRRSYGAMATNGSTTTNGHAAAAAANANANGNGNGQSSKFDPNFTQNVIDLMSPETTPRNRQILTSLIRHMHDFCREVELTQEEWIVGVNYVNAIGQAYQKNRNEAWRVCDILGIES